MERFSTPNDQYSWKFCPNFYNDISNFQRNLEDMEWIDLSLIWQILALN